LRTGIGKPQQKLQPRLAQENCSACNRTWAPGVPYGQMDTSINPAAATQESTETPVAPIRLAFDSDAKKNFDHFEALFFQQGDEASLAYDSYEDPDPRIKRWLSYRTLMGISITSTTVAVIACIALWRHSTPAPAGEIATAPSQATGATLVAVANPAPPAAPAPAGPVAQPVAAENPAAAPSELAVPSTSPAAVVPAAAPAPEPVAPALAQAEPAKVEPVKAEPVNAEPAKAELAKVEQAKVEPVKADPPKAEQVKAEAPGAETNKAKAEAPVVAAAPAADSEARTRCRQSLHDKRAKDIVAVCSAAFEQDATDAEAAVAVAKVEFDRGRFSQAYAWSKKAIAANPAAAEAYVFAGGVEQNQGRGKAAKESYQHYLRLAPSGRYAAELRTIVNSL
jgi:hypothetical protein